MIKARNFLQRLIFQSLTRNDALASQSLIIPRHCQRIHDLIESSPVTHRGVHNEASSNRLAKKATRNFRQGSKKKSPRLPPIDNSLYQKCLYVKSILPKGEMDTETFQYCLSAIETYSKAENVDTQQLELAEQLIGRLADEIAHGNEAIVNSKLLLAKPYITVMRGWARTRTHEALDRCRALFDRMQERHYNQPHGQPNPHQIHVYSALLYTCGLTCHPEARKMADAWLKHAMEHYNEKEHLPVELYDQIILVHAQRAAEEYGAAAAAEDWLVHLSKLHTQGGPSPTTSSFNRVLRAWSISPENNAVQRAQTILNLMFQLQEDYEHVRPDADTFGTVLLACARHGQPEQAEELWNETIKYFEGRTESVDLSNCLNATTLAWSSSDSPEAPDRIFQLLQDSFSQQPKHNGITLNHASESLTNLLVALNRQGDWGKAADSLRHLWQAHKLSGWPAPLPRALHYLIRANNQYNDPTKSESAAILLLDAVSAYQKCRSLPKPEASTFNLCIDMCLAHKETKELALRVLDAAESIGQASTYTYTILINALCKDSTRESSFEALRVLKNLEAADTNPRSPVHLRTTDLGLYTKVLSSLASIPDPKASDACLSLFESISSSNRWHPSTRMYTSVIFSLRVKGQNGRRKAYDIFKELVNAQKRRSGNIKLDSFLFETLLRVMWQMGDVEAAQFSHEILSTMMKLHGEGEMHLTPTQVCFDVALTTLMEAGLVKQVGTLLDDIIERQKGGQFKELPSVGAIKKLKTFLKN